MPVITDVRTLRREVLEKPYSEENYRSLLGEIFGTSLDLSYEPVEEEYTGFKVLGDIDLEGKSLTALSVKVENPRQLENLRKYHHRKVIKYLRDHHIDSALVAFYCEGYPNWRLSLFYIDYKYDQEGELIREESPYRRFTYLLGETEPAYTPTKQLWELIEKTRSGENVTLDDLKDAFSVEKLSDEFFRKYRNLYLKLKEHIERTNPKLISDLPRKGYAVEDFAKKTLGQLVFLYFLQKKGWLCVPQDKPYGEGDRKFLRNLFQKAKSEDKNFYRDCLEPLFYNTLNNPRTNQAVQDWSGYFNCRIPFLNGGLFEPIYDYDNDFVFIDNKLFSNENRDGILDIFDTYNFTIKEDEPLEKEVAVDPEMLGKVFENLISENERKGLGAFYTPREIVHYMSQQSLIYYLTDKLNLNTQDVEKIFSVDECEKLPESIKGNAEKIVEELKNIKVVDPACGSGAFLVGVLHEIVRARSLLEKTEDFYRLKKEAIENSIYGVDIDIGAVEIAKLRLWLSLVVDEENPYRIEPLPNLEYKIMCGNSLLEELVIGDEAIPLSVESQYKRDTLYQAEILETELSEKRKLFLDIVKAKGKNNKEAKELEKEIKNLEAKLKALKDKPQQRVNPLLIGSDINNSNSFDHIKKLQHQFFNEHDPEKKKALKEEIDSKLREFILKKIEEEENKLWDKINQITRKYSGKKMPKSEEKKISRYSQILHELDKYKKNLNFKGCNKNFFLWHLNFSEVFIEKGGFDIVIANPPYVGEAGHKELIQEIRRSEFGKRFGQGKMDYFHFFLQKAIHDLSHSESIIAFITTNYYFAGAGASKLRESIKNHTDILELINFNEMKIFDSAQGQHNAVIILSKIKKGRETYYVKVKSKNRNDIEKILFNKSCSNDISESFNTVYIFDKNGFIAPQKDDELLRVRRKLEKDAVYLDKDDITQGIVMPQDFVVKKHLKILGNTAKVGEGIFVLSDEELKRLNLTEKEIKDLIRPYYTTNELDKYCGNPKNRYWIIYTTTQKIKEIEKYPNIKRHLDRFKQIITSDFAPYGLHRARDEYFFKGKKIISRRMTKEPVFTYTDFDCYVSQTFFVIKPRSENLKNINLKFLTGLLNSTLSYWFFYNFGKRKGEQLQIDKEPLMNFPIKLPDKETEQQISSLVEKICQLKRREDYPHRLNLQRKVQEYGKQIDRLIYSLYGLTDKEIQIVERNLEAGNV